MSDKALNDKLKKIKALAERGVGGEMENAKALLAQLMEAHGLNEEDLHDETRELHFVPIMNKYEASLLAYMFPKFCIENSVPSSGIKLGRKRGGSNMTKLEWTRFSAWFAFYQTCLMLEDKKLRSSADYKRKRKAKSKEGMREALVLMFVHKNNLGISKQQATAGGIELSKKEVSTTQKAKLRQGLEHVSRSTHRVGRYQYDNQVGGNEQLKLGGGDRG